MLPFDTPVFGIQHLKEPTFSCIRRGKLIVTKVFTSAHLFFFFSAEVIIFAELILLWIEPTKYNLIEEIKTEHGETAVF